MEELYHELILDLYKNPLNKKRLDNFDISQVAYNPLCGEQIEIFVKFDANEKIIDISFEGEGCVISQAGGSVVTEFAKGKSKQEIQAITAETIAAELGLRNLNPTRLRCLLLALQALQKTM